MPEASINEYGELDGRKDDIGVEALIGQGPPMFEVPKPSVVESCPDRNLQFRVLASVPEHRVSNARTRCP
jgi:hypothetical protein